MLEHLISPDCIDPFEADTQTLVAAQANTADFLSSLHATDEALDEDEKTLARQAFTAVADPAVKPTTANAAILKLKTPATVKYFSELLTAYDWEYVEQASQIRSYVVSGLLKETENPDPKIRIAALKALGNVTEVGAFTERIEVKRVDASEEELDKRLGAKLTSLLPKIIEIETVEPKDAQ